MLTKKVARLFDAASAAIRSVRTFSMMWMPLSVSSRAWTGKACFGFSLGITSTAQVSVPTATTFCDASQAAASLPRPGSPLL